MSLESLLGEWKELEPGPVNSRFSDDDHWAVDHYVTVRVAGQYENVIQVMNDGKRIQFSTTPALVLAAVMEACEARALYWQVQRDFDGHIAKVQRSPLAHPMYALKAGPHDTPAEALLSAYLAVLRVENNDDEPANRWFED